MTTITKRYPLADGKYRKENKGAYARLSGEYRTPRKGEWYLSGAIPEAYQARDNYTTKFHIVEIIRFI